MYKNTNKAFKYFLTLSICFSIVISLFANITSLSATDTTYKNEPALNPEVNPEFTIQHYFYFHGVSMVNDGDEEHAGTLKIINTEGKKIPDNSNTWVPQWSVKVLDSGKIETERTLVKMFDDETTHFLNKPRMIYMNQLYNDGDGEESHYNKNYTMSEVWIQRPGHDSQSLSKDDFFVCESPALIEDGQPVLTPDGKQRHDPSKFIFTNNPDNRYLNGKKEPQKTANDEWVILIEEGTVVRLVFEVTESEEESPIDNVHFFDYDISDGGFYTTLDDALKKVNQQKTSSQKSNQITIMNNRQNGINSSDNYKNYNGTDAKYAFGNNNGGTQLGTQEWKQNINGKVISNKLNMTNKDVTGAMYGATFGLVSGLNSDGTLKWSEGINAPAIFATDNTDPSQDNYVAGKTDYINNEFKLKFRREGGTYTLKGVDYQDQPATGDLEKFTNMGKAWKSDRDIYSNNYWPMDSAASYGADGHDIKYGEAFKDGSGNYVANANNQHINNFNNVLEACVKSDDNQNHNGFFGMSFTVDYVIDPGYCAPLRYFFYGDDDLWIFLSKVNDDGTVDEDSTRLIADLGGVHASVGVFVDLWDYIEKIPYGEESQRYRISVFYTERGASGSTCYMRFSLPFESLSTDPITFDGELKIEKEVKGNEKQKKEDFRFKLKLENENGTELVNRYYYDRYDANHQLIEKSKVYLATGDLFYLKDGESIIVHNLPKGTRYTVEELGGPEHIISTFTTGTIDGGMSQALFQEGTKVSGNVDGLEQANYAKFINAMNPGEILLSKKMNDQTTPAQDFTFFLEFMDENKQPLTSVSLMKVTNQSIQGKTKTVYAPLDDLILKDGKGQVTLKANQSILIYNIPENTRYEITEEKTLGYQVDDIQLSGGSQTVVDKKQASINGVIKLKDGNKTTYNVTYVNKEVTSGFEFLKKQSVNNGELSTQDQIVKAGDIITYDLQVMNPTRKDQTDIVISDRVPAGLELINESISDNGQNNDGTITWDLGILKPGQVKNVSFKVKVPSVNKPTVYRNIATSSYIDEITKPNDSSSNEVKINQITNSSNPKTSDHTPLILWGGMMLAGAYIALALKKEYK